MIYAQNICKSINGKAILLDVNLELKRGNINVLFGASGCGKTTLCRNLALLDIPDSGILKIFDLEYFLPLKAKPKHLPYPRIGFVYQQLFLWPHLSNRENILLAVNKSKHDSNARFQELIDLLEIGHVIDQYPNESSWGQKQRVAIARTLILNPEFIFFDEITSALDMVQAKRIVSLIEKIKAQGIGCMIVTHDLNAFKNVADKFFFMQSGKIIEAGTASMIANPMSKELKFFLR